MNPETLLMAGDVTSAHDHLHRGQYGRQWDHCHYPTACKGTHVA